MTSVSHTCGILAVEAVQFCLLRNHTHSGAGVGGGVLGGGLNLSFKFNFNFNSPRLHSGRACGGGRPRHCAAGPRGARRTHNFNFNFKCNFKWKFEGPGRPGAARARGDLRPAGLFCRSARREVS
jgi:hypothetical protein